MLVNFCLFPGNCVAMLASITRVLFKHDKRTARETPGQSAYVVRSYCYRQYAHTGLPDRAINGTGVPNGREFHL